MHMTIFYNSNIAQQKLRKNVVIRLNMINFVFDLILSGRLKYGK